jgi:hypothetical protein
MQLDYYSMKSFKSLKRAKMSDNHVWDSRDPSCQVNFEIPDLLDYQEPGAGGCASLQTDVAG